MKISRPTQNTAYIIFANLILTVNVTVNSSRDEFTVWRVHWLPWIQMLSLLV